MEEQKMYYQLLKPVRRQLLFQKTIVETQYWLTASAAFVVIILTTARMMVVPFYHLFIWVGCFLLLIVYGFRFWRNRPGWKEAAMVFNRYIPDDRVITALSFIDSDGILEKLQLKEALTCMKREQHRVLSRKQSFFLPKWLFLAVLLVTAAALIASLPNDNLKMAAKKETEIKVLKKVKKELAEKTAQEKTGEKKKALEQAQKIITQNSDPLKALEQLAKQKKELELKALKEQEKQEKLEAWKQELKNNDLAKMATAIQEKDIEKIRQELEQLNKNYNSLTEGQKQAIAKMSGIDKKLSEQELAELAKKISEGFNAETVQKQLVAAQNAITTAEKSLQGELAAKGLPPNQPASNQASGKNPSGPSGKNGQPQTGASGQGQGQQGTGNGQQHGNGSETGSGSGNGNGSGTGSGSGSGSGQGSGTGTGSGAGLGPGSRQLLTIPEKQSGKTNLETDTGTLSGGSPAEQYQGNGPILPGQLRPYQDVYSSYLDAYRKSQDRVKLPADLEEIVKNYFLSLDPNRE